MAVTGGLVLASDTTGYLMPEPSWDLRIYVTDLQVERTLRVKGDMHIGGIMLRLVEELDVTMDWSDHALWWPKKNTWLSRTRATLNQYGVQADAYLNFTPMHKPLRLQMPDLRYVDVYVNFSVQCFTAVVQLCKELGIRYPEEMSFCRPLSHEHLKRNFQTINVTARQRGYDSTTSGTLNLPSAKAQADGSRAITGVHFVPASGTIDTRSRSPDITSTLSRNASYRGFTATSNANVLGSPLGPHTNLATSPPAPSYEARQALLHPRSLVEKARMNAGWLDSSLSLYEQNVKDYDTLLLRFKYLSFYDLNPKLDSVRINQIYDQAKWSLLTEEIDCSEDEAVMFGALQLQIQQQANNPLAAQTETERNDDDIDAALTELQLQLEGANMFNTKSTYHQTSAYRSASPILSQSSGNQVQQGGIVSDRVGGGTGGGTFGHVHPNIGPVGTEELSDYLRFMKAPRRFTLKSFKRLFFVFSGTQLSAYKTREDRTIDEPAFVIDILGCEVTPVLAISIGQSKYGVKLATPGPDGMVEYLIRFDSESQYARWLAAFNLASKGRSIADAAYDDEVRSTLDYLSIQNPNNNNNNNNNTIDTNAYLSSQQSQHQSVFTDAPYTTTTAGYTTTSSPTSPSHDINAEDYVAPRHARRLRPGRSMSQRILDAHSNVRGLSATECKLNYIRAWNALPNYGIHLFVARFMGSKRDEILGLAMNRLIRIDPNTGEHIRTWRYTSMKAWNVNWEIRQMLVQFEQENVAFSVLSADCKIPHEFIGGYTFLALRSKDNNQSLNEDLFYKLTAGF
ncbi:Unc-112-related protein, partial [Fragariocoptes setiger]